MSVQSGVVALEHTRFEQFRQDILANATPEQLIKLILEAQTELRTKTVNALTAMRTLALSENRICPHCDGKSIHRHGRDANGRTRFRCVGEDGCGRTFGVLHGTAFHRMRKPECWVPYVEKLLEGLPLTRIVEAGVGVSRHTAWRWRHRFLSVLSISPQPKLSGIIEVDEKYFPTSYKGSRGWKRGYPPEDRPPRYRGSGALKRGISGEQVPILTAVDRNRNHLNRVLGVRSVKAVLAAMSGALEPQSVICSDAFQGYQKLAEATGSAHHVFIPKKPTPEEKAVGLPIGREGALGLGRINSWHELMETRFNRTHRGVSTARLPSYLTMLVSIHGERLQPEGAMKRVMERLVAPRPRSSPTPISN
jgi:transposase-like protein